jgi:pimeloyl-ACP methyl ester carboxylesterase
VELEYETFGFADDPTLILVPGLGGQLLMYDAELCQGFVDRGFHVIRMDNRDSGLSTIMTDGDTYGIAEMADDVVAVLDHAGVDRCVVLGFGMGGMIAHGLAIDHADRVAGLVSLASTTGESHVGQATDEARAALTRSGSADAEANIDRALADHRILGNPDWYDEAQQRAYLERAHARAHHRGATARQRRALVGYSPRVAALQALDVPTLVVHGALDPLIDASGGRRTAELIPGAEYLEIEGMAHDLAPQMWPQLISAVTALSARAEW